MKHNFKEKQEELVMPFPLILGIAAGIAAVSAICGAEDPEAAARALA